MRAAVLNKVKSLSVEEREIPILKHGEVLIKVMACGVCGTDVHIFEGDKGAADNPLPIILGHEFAGVVAAVAEDEKRLKIGDRVCVDPNVLCNECMYCLEGDGNFCESMTGVGTTVDGGFSQYVAVPRQQVYKLEDNTTFEEGAMAEPLACCLHGMDLVGVKQGDNVVVIGAGMIGLLMVQLAKIAGAATVTILEPVQSKREMAQNLGADYAIDPTSQSVEVLLKENGIRRINSVIECVGHPATIEQAIKIAGKKSTIMMFGLTKPEQTVSISPYEIFKKEIVLKASFINPYTMGRAVDLLNNKRIDVSSMVAKTIPLEELTVVLEDADMRKLGKYIVCPWQ